MTQTTEDLFSEPLSPVFPSQVNVDLTEFCNLSCTHCPYDDVLRTKGASRRHLDEALHAKLIDEIADNGGGHCAFIRYTGEGEPMLHPRHAEMIAYAKARTGLPINLTTNGALLTAPRITALLEAGVDVFDISIDAYTDATYAQIRRRGELPEVRGNVRRLISEIAAAHLETKVVVSFVRQPLNENEVDDFSTFWRQEGADFVLIRERHSCAGAIEDIRRQMWHDAPDQRRPCVYPWERLVLKPDGSVCFCPADWTHSSSVGNITDQSIKEIWQGDEMEKLRAAHVNNDYSEHPFCGQCPDWMAMKWPHEGRRYGTLMSNLQSKNARKA